MKGLKFWYGSDTEFTKRVVEAFHLAEIWPYLLAIIIWIAIANRPRSATSRVVKTKSTFWPWTGVVAIVFLVIVITLQIADVGLFEKVKVPQVSAVMQTVHLPDSQTVGIDSLTVDGPLGKKAKEVVVRPFSWTRINWAFILFAIWAAILFWRRRKANNVSARMWIPVALLAGALLQNPNLLISGFRGLFSIPKIEIGNLLGGVAVLVFFDWRFQKSRQPKTWNMDPDTQPDQRGPTPHWWGAWSAGLTGLVLGFLIIFWPFCWTSWPDRWDKDIVHAWQAPIAFVLVILALNMLILAYRLGGLSRQHIDSAKNFSQLWLRELQKWSKLFKRGANWWLFPILLIRLVATMLLIVVLWKLMSVSIVPLGVLLVLSLPPIWLLGGYYYPPLRVRYVPRFFRKPQYSNIMFLQPPDKRHIHYIDGPTLTWWASWLPGFDVLVVPLETIEVEDIQTADVPTLIENAESLGLEGHKISKKVVSGPPVNILGKVTVQRYDPEVWLRDLTEEDRINIKEVITRYVLSTLREVTRLLTYSQAKTQDYYEYAVRWRDLGLETNETKRQTLIQEYLDHARLRIKVSSATFAPVLGAGKEYLVASGHYVREDGDGVFIPATFWEYLDWLLLTMTGCRVVEIDILDVTNKEIEAAEQAYAISLRKLMTAEVDKARAEIDGQAEGLRLGGQRAGEIKMVAEQLKADPSNAEAVSALTAMIGAENAGVLFGIADKIRKAKEGTVDANDAKAGSKSPKS